MKSKVILAIMLLLSASFLFGLERTKNLTLDAQGIERLEIDSGAGFLKITGVKGLTNIEVEAEILVRGMGKEKAEKFIKDNLELRLERYDHRARLVGKFKPRFNLFSWGEKLCNLIVHIPEEMDILIDDGSGFINIDQIKGQLNIDDGSGSIRIRNVTGDIEVDDGSGPLEIVDITGSVRLDDGSGEIIIKNVEGDFHIDDGSGNINMDNIHGSVTLSDNSGSIWMDTVSKDLIIQDDGSGDVKISNVKGRVIK